MTRTLYVFFISALLSTHLEGQVIARLVKAEGRVLFKRLGMSTFSEQGRPGAPIKNGDEIKVGEKSFAAVIYLDDRSILKVRENTKFSFMDTRNSRTVDLAHGTLLNDIKKEGRKKDFRIQTPVSVASVKGTEFAAIVSQSGVDQFICKEGLFEVLNMISGNMMNSQYLLDMYCQDNLHTHPGLQLGLEDTPNRNFPLTIPLHIYKNHPYQ